MLGTVIMTAGTVFYESGGTVSRQGPTVPPEVLCGGGKWERQRCKASIAGFSNNAGGRGGGGRGRDAKHRWLGSQVMQRGGGVGDGTAIMVKCDAIIPRYMDDDVWLELLSCENLARLLAKLDACGSQFTLPG